MKQLGSRAKQFSKYIIKKTNLGIRLFVSAESETGYVHNTGNMCNLPYFEKPISRIILSLMDRL
jgi:hypothetical protein